MPFLVKTVIVFILVKLVENLKLEILSIVELENKGFKFKSFSTFT